MPGFYGAFDPFTKEEYQRITDAALTLLEHTGAFVNCEEMLEHARARGLCVDFDKKVVKFPREAVLYDLSHCPGSLDRREPQSTLRFSCDGGCGYVYDYEKRFRRNATVDDIANFSRLADALPEVDEISFPCFDPSVPYEIQDLTIFRQVWANTAKTSGGGLSRNNAAWLNVSREAIDLFYRLATVRYGGEREGMIACTVCAASPLRFEREMTECELYLIEKKQTVGLGSNVIGGIQSPVTLAALVTMEMAERLAAMSLLLSVDRNASFFFCNHPNFLDLVTLDVADGSPEHQLSAACATGLLRYHGFRLNACHPVLTTGAPFPDAQAAMEKTAAAMIAGLTGAGGICVCGGVRGAMSYEQLVIDAEMAGMVKRYLTGLDVTDETIAEEVMEEVGIGGNFLSHEFTAEHCREVYWKPTIANRLRYTEWAERDGKDMLERAHERANKLLCEHHPKILTDAQEREMDEIVEEGKRTLIK